MSWLPHLLLFLLTLRLGLGLGLLLLRGLGLGLGLVLAETGGPGCAGTKKEAERISRSIRSPSNSQQPTSSTKSAA